MASDDDEITQAHPMRGNSLPIKAGRERFAAYSEEVCRRKPEDLNDFERHGVALAYKLEVPAKDAMDFLKQFGGSVARVKEAWTEVVGRYQKPHYLQPGWHTWHNR